LFRRKLNIKIYIQL